MRFEFTVICQIYYVGMKKASKLMSKFLALETKKKKKKKNILAQNRECREGSGLQKQIEVSPSCPAGCTE